jgi:hypothetical protein
VSTIKLFVQSPCLSSAANQQWHLLNYFKEGVLLFCIFSISIKAKKMISMLDKYLKKLESCFFIYEKDFTEISNDNFMNDKPDLILGIIEKENYRESWNLLIESLKKKQSLRIRDMTIFGQRHSFNALITFSYNSSGLIFSINFPHKLIGFRYAEITEKVGTKKMEEILSYSKIGSITKSIKQEVEKEIYFYFPSFEIFNNKYADYKVSSIIIDGMDYKEIDLWQAFFSTNDHGVL